ncbi:uncharacterized protein K452DRAFT_274225 [Aplosporella prunicola CBS 121167]|uniref:Metallo-beta-lactamase domain-containing protein n=1 Tax=Aplosporella prunicola CBS 121167 TaxID=1176127 RepID=A0A6A6B8U4_9PEZI|nr:uncharacterized protein K452DRAFT_274225 [Aplosporella prunicola CBS 121167]KAF2139783.1 hypothetical protein K452DRAFT_274225 [Aplosporella prunicola CBS 121167]
MSSPKPATDTIKKQQEDAKNNLPFSDTQDFDDAQKGLIGRRVPNTVVNSDGVTIWDNDVYQFLRTKDSPDTANPSLWRQSNLCAYDGLFEVTEGIYQVRGLDVSNTTIIEGTEGIIVIDPLGCAEVGAAAFELYQQYRGTKKVKAVMYTHSHIDHFGGVKGFISQEDVDSGAVQILAPEGFLEHAVSENVYAGTAMGRRAAYMYGEGITRSPQTQIGVGLGQSTSTFGTSSLIAPTLDITTTGQEETIDGVKMVFQMAPDTEAPSEMLIFFPDFKALCAAEDATHNFHNLLTLRGALVRDPHGWSGYLTETINLFGGKTDVLFASHQWPTWGSDRIISFLSGQRDLYAYVHDQTLRLLNQGLTGPEIAEQMTLPPAIDQTWSSRGYYGSVSHNVKAIYQRYIGWFDGNPSHLWEHIPVERAKRYVDLAGGSGPLVSKAQEAYNDGDFRWAAELLNHAVFADATNADAKSLLADTYEQLGYGAENGTWRNFFLSGTQELRVGSFGTPALTSSSDMLSQLTPEMLFDVFAIQINGPNAWDVQLAIDVVLTDRSADAGNNRYRWWLSNGALIYTTGKQSTSPDVTLTTTTRNLPALAIYGLDPTELKKAGIQIDGDESALTKLASLLDPGNPGFNIVTP